jgi:hypothetical protein
MPVNGGTPKQPPVENDQSIDPALRSHLTGVRRLWQTDAYSAFYAGEIVRTGEKSATQSIRIAIRWSLLGVIYQFFLAPNKENGLLVDNACNDPDINQRAIKVKQKAVDKIKSNTKLKSQYEGDPGQGLQPRFKFEVRKSPSGNYLEALFEGGISGDDSLKELGDILKDFKKNGCLLKVFFVKPGTMPLAASAPAEGFDLISCEWPNIACPNGECRESCN